MSKREAEKPITLAMAYALAYAEAVRRTNENRAASQPRLRTILSQPNDETTD